MHNLVRTVFKKLSTLNVEEEEEKVKARETEEAEGELKMTVQSAVEAPERPETSAAEDEVTGEEGRNPELAVEEQQEVPSKEVQSEGQKSKLESIAPPTDSLAPPEERPLPSSTFQRSECEYLYHPWFRDAKLLADGLGSVLPLLRVLVSVLDPNDQQHTDSTRIVALGILNAAFEEAGSSIGAFPSLRSIITDSCCKFLFQLARSENSAILHLALRTIGTMFNCMRRDLKLQQELLLTFTIDRLSLPPAKVLPSKRGLQASPRPGTPNLATPPLGPSDEKGEAKVARPVFPPARGEIRQYILETLNDAVQQPNFMVDLYANYDCDTNCENLFEKMVEFMTKVNRPHSGRYQV